MFRIWILLGLSCIWLVGCSAVKETDTKTDIPAVAEAEADENLPLQNANKVNEDGDIAFTYKEISLTLPSDWEGRYVVKEDEEGFSFLQKASHDKTPGSGFLFHVFKTSQPFLDAPGAAPIAYTKNCLYYFGLPTDVPFDCEDEAVAEDYMDMQEDLVRIKASISIDKEDVISNASEYVCPMSEYCLLTEEMLFNMSDNWLWLARNEIYARHGYHFKNPYLQAYFEKYSWYEDRQEDFSENEFSQTEKDNIALLKAVEDSLIAGNPYPMEMNTDKTISADLTGKGQKNKVLYQVVDNGRGWYSGRLTVDDKVYDLEEDFDIYMDIPEDEHFYITDISPHFEGLEIAIADYGPSDDPVTHFFVYTTEAGLELIGSVPGFPMKQMGFENGFTPGCVRGYSRCMTLDVHEYWLSYWYNYDEKRLELQEGENYHFDMPRAHILLQDLPLLYTKKEDSESFIVPKGSKVFFKECMENEWVLVHGPNGVEGYLHYKNDDNQFPILDSLDLLAEEVFDGLMIYD